MKDIRLQKFLADNGVASRRKCEEFILNGKVKVNGKVVTELGSKVDSKKDKVFFENKLIKNKDEEKVYILLNKPTGYVTTVNDDEGRKTVMDLIKGISTRIVPVGRLDVYTSGALILSNDGDFIYKVTHPKFEIKKTYVAKVKGIVKESDVEKMRSGVKIENYVSKPAEVKIIEIEEDRNLTTLQIVIHEGKNREVRKICETLGYGVYSLKREKIGDISVKGLKRGKWKYLKKEEIKLLLSK